MPATGHDGFNSAQRRCTPELSCCSDQNVCEARGEKGKDAEVQIRKALGEQGKVAEVQVEAPEDLLCRLKQTRKARQYHQVGRNGIGGPGAGGPRAPRPARVHCVPDQPGENPCPETEKTVLAEIEEAADEKEEAARFQSQVFWLVVSDPAGVKLYTIQFQTVAIFHWTNV